MTTENTSDSSKIEVSLARIEVQVGVIASSVEEIKKNLTMGDGSTLRDSVRRVVSEEIRDRHSSCGNEMKLVADSSASIAVQKHLQEYHKKASTAPKPTGFNWASLQPVAMFLLKRVLPLLLAGGATLGGAKMVDQLDQSDEKPAQVSTQKGE